MDRKKALRAVVVIVCLYLAVTTVQSIADLWRAGDKVTRREQELGQLLKERDDLLRQQREAQSPLFLERVARDELGMSKPGEKVVVIPQELLLSQEGQSGVVEIPIWRRWIKLLF
jgi:cell division protein FtsB